MSWTRNIYRLLESFITDLTRIKPISQTDNSRTNLNHYFVVTTKAKPLNNRKPICCDMEGSLEDRTGKWGRFLRDFSKQATTVSLYVLSLFGTQSVITPPKAHSFSLVELLQSMESKGNFDRYRDSVYLLADEGDNLSSRTDVDHPSHRDVIIGWNDAQQNIRKPGSYHIYSKDMNRDQFTSQWGDFIGSASLHSSQFIYRVDGDEKSVQTSDSNLPNNSSVTLEDGNYVFTVIYVPDQGDFEIIGQNTHGFSYKTDPNEPLSNPSPQPSPSQTAINVPTPTSRPTYTPTPSPSATSTSTPSSTPTLTPSPTEIPPTATITPTPALDIRIRGYVDTLIADDNQEEGAPISGAVVSLIPVHYSPGNVRREAAIGGIEVITSSNGEYDLQMPQSITDQYQEVRLRIIGSDHIDRVGPIINIRDYEFGRDVKIDDVIPDGFNIESYNHIFRSNASINYNGENVNIQQKLRANTPFVILDAPAQHSAYVPTDDEKNIYLTIINEELPEITKGRLNQGDTYIVHTIDEVPWLSVLGMWNDSNFGFGSAGITLTEEGYPHIITQADFNVNTIRKIREKEPGLSEQEAIDWYTRVARQEIGSMAGGTWPYFPGDPGGLQARETVFHETQAAQTFTQFDKDSLYINYVRDMIATPSDLNVSMKKYIPSRP